MQLLSRHFTHVCQRHGGARGIVGESPKALPVESEGEFDHLKQIRFKNVFFFAGSPLRLPLDTVQSLQGSAHFVFKLPYT